MYTNLKLGFLLKNKTDRRVKNSITPPPPSLLDETLSLFPSSPGEQSRVADRYPVTIRIQLETALIELQKKSIKFVSVRIFKSFG